MAQRWPTRWRQDLIRDLGIPETQFGLDALSAWQKSTPLEPWTNNPLGLDAKRSSRPSMYTTAYAVFPAMSDFRSEMVRLKSTSPGRTVATLLGHGDSYAELWRAIQRLNTPGKRTETDYPHRILDLATKAYEDNIPPRTPGKRKTTGVVTPKPNPHHIMAEQSKALHHAANRIDKLSDGIAYIIRRMN